MSSILSNPPEPTPDFGSASLQLLAGLPTDDSGILPHIHIPQELALSPGLAADDAIAQFTAATDSTLVEITPSVQFLSQDPTTGSLAIGTQASDISQEDVITGVANAQPLVLNLNQTLDVSKTFQDQLDTSDSLNPTRPRRYKDDYLFTAPELGKLQLDLISEDFNTYLQIIDANTGKVLLKNDNFNGKTDAHLSFDVQAGSTFIIRATSAYAFETGSYSLKTYLATDSDPGPQPPTAFDPTYGYGLVDAAAAVSKVLNQSPFEEVADIGGLEWNNDLIKAPETWAQGYTGKGIVVAVIDSGVDINHEDLKDNIWSNAGEIASDGLDNDGNGYIDDVHGWNFGVGQNNNDVTPGTNTSGQTHGTHVAGTIAAKNNGIGMTGVAPDAKIMAIRMGNVNQNGAFTNAGNLATAIRYAVDNGAGVINMSLGWQDSSELTEALAYAASKNVITVSAAGNSGLATSGTPAKYATDYGLSVGAVDSNKNIASFSNRAGSSDKMQHVVAPGVNIYSTLPGNEYGFKQGTSMASPHVAGVVALMLSANPNLTHAQVREILTSTSISLTDKPKTSESPLSTGIPNTPIPTRPSQFATDAVTLPQWDKFSAADIPDLALNVAVHGVRAFASAHAQEKAGSSQPAAQGYQVDALMGAQLSFQAAVDSLKASSNTAEDDLILTFREQNWTAQSFAEPVLA
ncbi:MAG TPA: S8 family peptidase [Leptolyngbyaceae cyanobacterium]